MQAAKEAVGEQNKASSSAIAKSEAAMTKQIDQIMTLIQTCIKGLDDKITDMKDRLTRVESLKEGASASVTDHRASGQYIVMFVSVLISVVAVSVAILHK